MHEARNANNVKPREAVAYWERPDVRAHYGPYTFTYGLMSARYLAATEASRAKRKAKEAQDDEETINRRITANAQVRERKKESKLIREADLPTADSHPAQASH